MEFPTLGQHCQFGACNQTDFLPLQCKCGMVFCREHFQEHCLSGKCELAPPPRAVNFKTDDQIYKCSEEGCRKGNLHELICPKCNKHYCIEHRFHATCPEIDDETMALKIEQYEAPRKQFQEANKHLQDKITEKLRQALQSSTKVKTASKIHLMRIKQKALGPKSIPVGDRVYFSIKKPIDMEPKPIKIVQDIDNLDHIESISLDPDIKGTVPVFISTKWSLGRAIDSICETCKIKNENNKVGSTKLRLFRELDGYCISAKKMDLDIQDLLSKEILLEGDKLVVEYIDDNIVSSVDESAQIFLN